MKTRHVLQDKYSTEEKKLFKTALRFAFISVPMPFLVVVILYTTFSPQSQNLNDTDEEPDVQVG